jgi:nucleoside permease NupC
MFAQINFRIVISGVLIQIILGVIVMRTRFGFYLFKFLGNQVAKFLNYTDYGTRLVFGVKHTDHFFAFKVIWS